MDPDMVRQQEEAEAASRMRRIPLTGAAIQHTPVREAPFLLRADARDHLIAPAPVAPPKLMGWGAVLRATTSCFALTTLGLTAGTMLGVKLGLVSWQSLAIGAGTGYLLGWQSAVTSLRRRYQIALRRALRAPLTPTAIILASLIAGMAVAAHRLGIPAPGLSDASLSDYWFDAGIVALIGYALALLTMRKALRP